MELSEAPKVPYEQNVGSNKEIIDYFFKNMGFKIRLPVLWIIFK
jgi:hypothetical protein